MDLPRRCQVAPVGLEELGRKYVKEKLLSPQGLGEAVRGTWHKLLPRLLGQKSISLKAAMVVTARTFVVCATAVFPIAVRKLYSDQLTELDGKDAMLALAAIGLAFSPRVIDWWSRDRSVPSVTPAESLASAIAQMPSLHPSGAGRDGDGRDATNGALLAAVLAIKEEFKLLLADSRHSDSVEVVLLEFAKRDGTQMRVRERTSRTDHKNRPVPSAELLAYHAARTGHSLLENDFLAKSNPYPKRRLTVPQHLPMKYRSVMYLPVVCSERSTDPQLAAAGVVTDYCLGVICVHCEGAYQFWKWGDHRVAGGQFDSVAYTRSSAYIALVSRLLEISSLKVPLEPL